MLGKRIREERQKLNLTQEELGNKCGVTKYTISLYESGKSTPNDEIKGIMADLFDCTIDYLLGRSDLKNNVIIEGNKLPKELRDIGIEYLEVAKEMEDAEIPPEDIKKIIDIIKGNTPKKG